MMECSSLFLTAKRIKKICNKTIDNYTHALKFVPDCFKTEKIGNKAGDTYAFVIQFVPEYYKTQEMRDKAVITCFSCISFCS